MLDVFLLSLSSGVPISCSLPGLTGFCALLFRPASAFYNWVTPLFLTLLIIPCKSVFPTDPVAWMLPLVTQQPAPMLIMLEPANITILLGSLLMPQRKLVLKCLRDQVGEFSEADCRIFP